jgi:hypothetical protein
MPFMNSHRDGWRVVLTSQRSVTMRYLMTPESLMSVFTPYEVIIETESSGLMAGAVCSFALLQEKNKDTTEATSAVATSDERRHSDEQARTCPLTQMQ